MGFMRRLWWAYWCQAALSLVRATLQACTQAFFAMLIRRGPLQDRENCFRPTAIEVCLAAEFGAVSLVCSYLGALFFGAMTAFVFCQLPPVFLDQLSRRHCTPIDSKQVGATLFEVLNCFRGEVGVFHGTTSSACLISPCKRGCSVGPRGRACARLRQ